MFLDLENRDCLVVGGGKVAARKVGLLRRAGARVACGARAGGATSSAAAVTARGACVGAVAAGAGSGDATAPV